MQDLPEASLRARSSRPSHFIALLLALVLAGSLAAEYARWGRAAAPHVPARHADHPAAAPAPLKLVRQSASRLAAPPGAPSAHASALVALPGDHMLAFWFAGSRESAPDVQIYASRWADGGWGPTRPVASRASLGEGLGFAVRRIGNPTAWAAPDGTVHLYVVATGLGGWAASRVVHLVSSDLGDSFQVRRVLPMSPLFNTSVMVRTTPVGLSDGGWWLPLYFELGSRYPLLMSFDAAGEPRWIVRIGERNTLIQPAVIAVSRSEVRAWMRDASEQRRIQQAVSHDGGANWVDAPPLDLVNDNTSVAALKLREGGFVLLHNDGPEGAAARNVLRLSVSDDARTWTHAFDIAAGEPLDEFSYPGVQQLGDELHVTFTDRRRTIAHHVYRIRYGEGAP